MEKSVLLCELGPYRQLEIDFARLDPNEPGAERRHEKLALEAGANARRVVRGPRSVLYHCCRHATHTAGIPKSTISRRSHDP